MPDDDIGQLAERFGWDLRHLPGWTRVTVDTRISEVPALFFGALVTSGVTGDGIALYDGKDATSGQIFGAILVEASITSVVLLPHPVPFRDGIFMAVVDTLTEATILWRPMLPEEVAAWP